MYWNTLTKIKNALERKHDRIKVPSTKLDLAIVEALVRHGYLESAAKKGKGVKKIIDIRLKYKEGVPAISGIKFFSRPSRRVYMGYEDMQRSKSGYGYFFFSTPMGLMTNIEARKNKVGGEMLFEIW